MSRSCATWRRGARRSGLATLLGRIRGSLRAAGVRTRPAGGGRGGLSARETEILGLVGAGLDSAAIAGRLGTARSTVDTQLRSAMRKLGARTRWEAAAHLVMER